MGKRSWTNIRKGGRNECALIWLRVQKSAHLQTNSFWHLQTGIRSCPCDRSGPRARHAGSYREACYYYFCRRRVRGLPIPDPSVQRGRVVHTLSRENTQYQIIHQYQREEDQLSELFSSPRWSRTSQYI